MWDVCDVSESLRCGMFVMYQRVGNVRCLRGIREFEI